MSALTTQEATMHARQPGRRASPPPPDFRSYLLDGDHWRAARRVRGARARFDGLALHRKTGGDDGQEGAHQFTSAFMEFLEQARVDDLAERQLRQARVRHALVEDAIAIVAEDRPDEVKALQFYGIPRGRRPRSVEAEAELQGFSVDAFRDAAVRAVVLVWEELGLTAW